jgi:anti-sigma B factor antagonist
MVHLRGRDMQFVVEGEPEGGVRVAGELDMSTVNDLLEGVRPHLLAASGDFTLDLSQLSFMDSTGLLAFLDMSRELEGRGRLVLRSPAGSVARLLQLARAETIPNVAIVSDQPTAA